jgi:hypothetical protein
MQMTQQARGPAAERVRSEAHPCARRRGSILVEFALVSLAFYLILAGTLEVGRMITSAQIVQNAARTMARELALLPLPATMTFEEALDCPTVRARIFDRTKLAVLLPDDLAAETNSWPTVNRILLPLMVVNQVGDEQYLQFPGAVVDYTPLGGTAFRTVRVPQVVSRGADGVETIRWVDVIEEIRFVATDPTSGAFSMLSTGPELGLVALRVNCPYQAATMSAFQPVDVTDPDPTNEAILANDGGVTVQNSFGTAPVDSGPSSGGIYDGPYGLGKFYALNKEVRPFRRLISGQAVFRREVFTAGTGCP